MFSWNFKTLRQIFFLIIRIWFSWLKVNEDYEPVQVSSYDDNMKRWLKYYPLHKFHIVENKELDQNPLQGKQKRMFHQEVTWT